MMKEKLKQRARRVTLKQLRVLAEVVRTGSLTGAAEALAVTPPAVSLQLRQLEQTVGLELTERTGEGVRATEAGREVLATASRIEAALGDCLEALEAMRDLEAGRVTVGVISTAKYFAPRALAAFKQAHPRVELRLLIGNRRDMIAALEGFDLDIAVMGRPPQHFAVEQAVIGAHPHVIIAAPGHKLAGRHALPLAALAAETFLLREPGSGSRALLEGLLTEARLSPEIGMEIGSNETIKQAVMAGMGIALISAHTIAAEVQDGRLAVLDVRGLPLLREWYVVKRREKRLLPAAQALWTHLATAGSGFLPVVPAAAGSAA
jgi:LysR family transcriptional regulator for metE and metH